MTESAFGELLRRLRGEAGLTQESLAERAGVSVEAIRALESGRRRRPWAGTVKALADGLRLTDDQRSELERTVRRAATSTVPRELPADVVDFTGREQQVVALTEALTGPPSPAVVMTAIAGMGGVGKTTLAVHVAHRLAEQFPDGQLAINLRGFGPGEPLTPYEAVATLLRSLGAAEIPDELDEAAARYRSMLAGRRMLILLDNASDSRQVRPLLPGSAGCAVLVTSRQALIGLAGARHVQVDVLGETEALELLAGIAGADRVGREPEAAREVVRLCGALPLALRIAAVRLALRPAMTMADLQARLADQRNRLDELAMEDLGVRSTIALSVADLAGGSPTDAEAARVFPLLSWYDGDRLDVRVAARLLDLDEYETETLLERLADVQLLQSDQPRLFRFHDLVRAYAEELAAGSATEEERARARMRVLELYQAVAWRLDELKEHTPHGASWVQESWKRPAKHLDDFAEGCAWLDQQRADLVKAVQRAAEGSADEQLAAIRIVVGLHTYFLARKRWTEWRDLGWAARRALLDQPDPLAEAMVRFALGLAYGELEEYDASADQLDGMAEAVAALGWKTLAVQFLLNRARALERAGRCEEGLVLAQETLDKALDDGDEEIIAGSALLILGMLYGRLGQADLHRDYLRRGIDVHRAVAPEGRLAMTLLNAGISYRELGLPEEAMPLLVESRQVHHKLGSEQSEAELVDEIGYTEYQLGRLDAAEQHLRAGLTIALRNDNWQRQASVRHHLGLVLATLGRDAEAVAEWDTALELYDAHGVTAAPELRELVAEPDLDRRRQSVDSRTPR